MPTQQPLLKTWLANRWQPEEDELFIRLWNQKHTVPEIAAEFTKNPQFSKRTYTLHALSCHVHRLSKQGKIKARHRERGPIRTDRLEHQLCLNCNHASRNKTALQTKDQHVYCKKQHCKAQINDTCGLWQPWKQAEGTSPLEAAARIGPLECTSPSNGGVLP